MVLKGSQPSQVIRPRSRKRHRGTGARKTGKRRLHIPGGGPAKGSAVISTRGMLVLPPARRCHRCCDRRGRRWPPGASGMARGAAAAGATAMIVPRLPTGHCALPPGRRPRRAAGRMEAGDRIAIPPGADAVRHLHRCDRHAGIARGTGQVPGRTHARMTPSHRARSAGRTGAPAPGPLPRTAGSVPADQCRRITSLVSPHRLQTSLRRSNPFEPASSRVL